MQELEATDIWRANYAPPLLVLQRKLGMKPKPPHYLSFWHVVLSYGGFFALIWGIAMWQIMWAAMGLGAIFALGVALVTGLAFGLAMAFAYSFVRRKWGLSRWEDL